MPKELYLLILMVLRMDLSNPAKNINNIKSKANKRLYFVRKLGYVR